MDVIQAINERKSIRAFKPDPLPKDLLARIMEAAIRAPSWANSQSPEFAVLTGSTLKDLSRAMISNEASAVPHAFDIPRPAFPEQYSVRSFELGQAMFESMGVARDDKEKRRQWILDSMRFFDAPALVVVYAEKGIGPYALFDAGLAMENIALAAWSKGVGSCMVAMAVNYPNEIRRILGLPASKEMICGVALGYPDLEHPVNKHRSTRVPLEERVKFYE